MLLIVKWSNKQYPEMRAPQHTLKKCSRINNGTEIATVIELQYLCSKVVLHHCLLKQMKMTSLLHSAGYVGGFHTY